MVIRNTVAAFASLVLFSLPQSGATEGETGSLLDKLRAAQTETEAQRLENQILLEWSKSGSQAMDLLLKRGRDALQIRDADTAAEHFRALTDHAPDFAEGWYGLALVLVEQDRIGPALDALERTLALNPDHFGALRGVGALHEQIGNLALAYRAYERVLDMRPHDADLIDTLARLETQVKGTSL